MARLRAPGGCPWDAEQTYESLSQYLLEEAYETFDAIHAAGETGDTTHLVEELGDLLLQVVFHSTIAAERGDFTIDDVAGGVSEKLILRHPHVFGDRVARTAEEGARHWQDIKNDEARARGEEPPPHLGRLPRSLPAIRRALAVQRAASVPLVVAGALLSTLHQSSLGSFYLIVPGKLHPLWYSSWLPILFFLSALAAGLGMVIVEGRLSSRAFGRGLELPLLASVGRGLMGALVVYGSVRLYDLARRGALGELLTGSREAAFFGLEFGLGVLLPLALLSIPAVRHNARWLYTAALFVVVGFVVNRLNVSVTGLEGALGGRYVPAVPEVLVTLMLVAIGFALFRLAALHLPVFAREKAAFLAKEAA